MSGRVEYLAPGVYVTEIATGAKPIEGVSTSTAGMVGSDTLALLQQMAQPTPDWTDFNENDPGIALLELFAFITESLVYRNGRLSEARQIARSASRGRCTHIDWHARAA
jgi:phage tail sheath protein FI